MTRSVLLVMSWTLFSCTSGGGTPGPADAGELGDAPAADSGGALGDAPAADSAGDAGTSVVACTTPDDCLTHIPAGPAVFCCIGGACIYGQAAEAETCSNPGGQTIKASNYDQSCSSDSDCAQVAEGDFCVPGAAVCPTATINKGALPQYQADVAKTQAAVCEALAGCPAFGGPCCRNGTCQTGTGCSAPTDTLAACADAGGSCSPFVTACGSMGAGPPDSCAYSDEMCCIN